MNISYRWLKALRPQLTLSPSEVVEALASRGAPVEDLVALASGLESLVVGEVLAVEPHPRAEKLSVCRVSIGGEGSVEVVCGAPNVRAGGRYPFAPVGARLPSGMEIGRREIRGIDSEGMLCSEAELELGPDGSGLLALAGEPEPGLPLTEALGLDDWLLDVEITANRGDLLSHLGVARELAPAGEAEDRLPPIPGAPSLNLRLRSAEVEVESGGVTVRVQDPDLCHRYLGAVVRGVEVGPSPPWLASRIRAAGSRPINNVVDATNYVLLELGQPLHAFDLGCLENSTIVVRRARNGELIRTLDGESRRLTRDMLAICDASEPVAIAGVMGGQDSEVSTTTTDILIECALFQPGSVRATRKALGMSTEASYRFERGVDPEGMVRALTRALEIVLATAGGEPQTDVLDVCPRPWERLEVPLRPARVKHVLGIDLSGEEIRELLAPLGFRVERASETSLIVGVPGFRSYDVQREVDLLEEVARTYGYDRFPEGLGAFRPGRVPDDRLFQVEDDLRDLLVAEGLLEAQTMAFAPESEGEVELSNPVSAEENRLRTALLPGLLRRVEYNLARGQRDIRLFELGQTFFAPEPTPSGSEPVPEAGTLPREEAHLALVLTGAARPPHWKEEVRDVDLWDLKGLAERVVPGARLSGVALAEGAPEGKGIVPEEGYSLVGSDGAVVGHAGRIEPSRLDTPAWAAPVWALELRLPDDPEPRPVRHHQPAPEFPGVERDLALVLPKGMPVRRVDETIRGAAGVYLVDLDVFDVYEGKGVPKDHRSVAFRLRFQSAERTLTDAEVDDSVATVVSRLREGLGVEPRG